MFVLIVFVLCTDRLMNANPMHISSTFSDIKTAGCEEVLPLTSLLKLSKLRVNPARIRNDPKYKSNEFIFLEFLMCATERFADK